MTSRRSARSRSWVALVLAAIVLAALAPVPGSPASAEDPVAGLTTETVRVDARSREGTVTVLPVLAGKTYLLEATGTYGFGGGTADAECATTDGADWRTNLAADIGASTDPQEDLLDLYVAGGPVEWSPVEGGAGGCAVGNHVYRLLYVAPRTEPLGLRIHDGGYGDNSGALVVTITRVPDAVEVATPLTTVQVESTSASGTDVSVTPGGRYRLVATGTYRAAPTFPDVIDAECIQLRPGAPGVRDLYGTVLTPTNPDDDLFDLYVDGGDVDWTPATPTPLDCDDTDHRYAVDITAAGDLLNLRVNDPHPRDNSGLLVVEVFELPPAEEESEDGVGLRLEVAEEVRVDSRSRTGATTTLPLAAGQPYVFEVTGTYGFGAGSADGECALLDGGASWVTNLGHDLGVSSDPDEDLLDVYVNGKAVHWVPANGAEGGCNVEDHAYRLALVAPDTGRVNFRVHDGGHGDNRGVLTARVLHLVEPEPAPQESTTVELDTSSAAGVTVPATPGTRYRIHASGTYSTAPSSSDLADAECVRLGGTLAGLRNAYGPLLRPTAPNDDLFDLYVEGQNVEWIATQPTPVGCNDTDHQYVVDIAAQRDRLAFRVNDPHPSDNEGMLTITVTELPEAPAAAGDAGTLRLRLAETVLVDSSSATGAASAAPLVAGRPYVIEASGTFDFGGGMADAECAVATGGEVWSTNLAHELGLTGPDQDLLDVQVGGRPTDWMPANGNDSGCDTDAHTYRLLHVPMVSERVTFRVDDNPGGHADNDGTVTVRIFHIEELSLGAVPVVASNPHGSFTLPLTAGATYRLVASGTYNPAHPHDFRADAECSRQPGGLFQPDLWAAVLPGEDMLDVYVGGTEVTWQPASGGDGCDPGNEYEVAHVADATAPLNLKVVDHPAFYADNVGIVSVAVYQRAW